MSLASFIPVMYIQLDGGHIWSLPIWRPHWANLTSDH